MTDMNEVLAKLEAFDESEVSKADQAILDFCFNAVKLEREARKKQEIKFSAILQALGRRLDIDNEELKDIYMSINRRVDEQWDEIRKKMEDNEEFARIISGINEDKEEG